MSYAVVWETHSGLVSTQVVILLCQVVRFFFSVLYYCLSDLYVFILIHKKVATHTIVMFSHDIRLVFTQVVIFLLPLVYFFFFFKDFIIFTL